MFRLFQFSGGFESLANKKTWKLYHHLLTFSLECQWLNEKWFFLTNASRWMQNKLISATEWCCTQMAWKEFSTISFWLIFIISSWSEFAIYGANMEQTLHPKQQRKELHNTYIIRRAMKIFLWCKNFSLAFICFLEILVWLLWIRAFMEIMKQKNSFFVALMLNDGNAFDLQVHFMMRKINSAWIEINYALMWFVSFSVWRMKFQKSGKFINFQHSSPL